MKNLLKYKIFESSNWWEDLINQHNFDIQFIKDIFQELIDDDIRVVINPRFMNVKFVPISKKADALESQHYCGYNIYVSDLKLPNNVSGFIDKYNKLFEALERLSSEFECQVHNYGGGIHISCYDTSENLDTKLVDYKGKKAMKLNLSKLSRVEYITKNLDETQHKILNTRIISDDLIEITPKIDINRVEEILNKSLQRTHGKFIDIYQHPDGEKILIRLK